MSKITNDGLTPSGTQLYRYGNSGRQRVKVKPGCISDSRTENTGW